MCMKTYYVYILSSKLRGVLYIGVTNNLCRRLDQHMNNTFAGFSSKYHTYNLVHYEITNDVKSAIHREKCLKRWKRDWKISLIEETNSDWKNIYHEIKDL